MDKIVKIKHQKKKKKNKVSKTQMKWNTIQLTEKKKMDYITRKKFDKLNERELELLQEMTMAGDESERVEKEFLLLLIELKRLASSSSLAYEEWKELKKGILLSALQGLAPKFKIIELLKI